MSDPTPTPAPAPPRPARVPALQLGLVLLSPFLALLVVMALPRRIDLWVVNGSDAPMHVSVGALSAQLDPRAATLLRDVPAGSLALGWQEGQDALRETSARVQADLFAPRATWVWDAGGHTPRFWIVSRGYGDHVAPSPEAVEVRGLWRFPPDLLPLVDQPLPEQIPAPSQGATGAIRRVLWSEHKAQQVQPARVRLLLDHEATVPADLLVDGRLVGTAAPGQVLRVEDLAPGHHKLEARVRAPDGSMGQTATCEADLTAEPLALPSAWVWRPWGGSPCWIVATALGQVDGAVPGPERFTPAEALFRVPAGLEPGLDEPPGRTLIARGVKGVVLRSLWTGRGLQRATQSQEAPAQFGRPSTFKDLLDAARPKDEPR